MLDKTTIRLFGILSDTLMSTRLRNYCLSACLCILANCATGVRNVFRLEPQNQITFGAYNSFKAGQVIHITILNRTKNEVFLANQCGEGCITSKLSLYHEFKDGQSENFLFTIPKDGEYYFWIKQLLPDGTEGPNKIVDFNCVGARFTAKFKTGTLVNGEITEPVTPNKPRIE